jgi:ribonuclease III
MNSRKYSTEEMEILDQCQEDLGYRFTNLDLLKSALTHTSGANTRANSNERLEFLGDSVLGLIVCEYLFHKYPHFQEGDMTKVKSAVVSRQACTNFSRDLHLEDSLFLGRGMQDREVPASLLANVFESVVGAVFLDSDYATARSFVLPILQSEIEVFIQGMNQSNHKSLLQTMVQRQGCDVPRYQILDEQGPDHARSYKIAVFIGYQRYPAAWGVNKKEAESRAAQNAIAMLKGEPIPFDADPA